jgi:hypothetical protein
MFGRLPPPLREALMPFQRAGVAFVLQQGGRALIADEMGLVRPDSRNLAVRDNIHSNSRVEACGRQPGHGGQWAAMSALRTSGAAMHRQG